MGSLPTILGGLGLFLLGMVILTDGLRRLSGDAQRRAVERFTKSPASGAVTGAVITVLVQSSSATTVAAVSFVGAGLLSFSHALGLILGANVGTTGTGWIVALLGFKLRFAAVASPLLFGGMLLRLFGRGRARWLGQALAGFALIFLGIEALKEGMAEFGGRLLPETFPADTLGGRLLLVAVGAVMTLVTQSSSAGVASVLAALHADSLSFDQAAAIVIGMDLGTTGTAALATLGGTVGARRTGLAHVVFNVFTCVEALLFLPLYSGSVEALWPGALARDPELSIAGFHTAFNLLATLLALPVAGYLARLMELLVREGGPRVARSLQPRLLREPAVALRVATSALFELVGEVTEHVAAAMREPARADAALRELDRRGQALREMRVFLGKLAQTFEGAGDTAAISAQMHVVDHLRRLIARSRKVERIASARGDPELSSVLEELAAAFDGLRAALPGALPGAEEQALHRPSDELRGIWSHCERRLASYRRELLVRAGRGAVPLAEATDRLDAQRWLLHVAYHGWRIAHHLSGEGRGAPEGSELEGNELDGDAELPSA